MTTKTIHVIPDNGRWLVLRSGVKSAEFSSQKAATAAAKKSVMASKAGQVVVHSRSGKLQIAATHGLPRIQRPAVKSKIGSEAIKKAVSTAVRERLATA